MKLALPSVATHSGGRTRRLPFPTRRRLSPAQRARQAATKAAKGTFVLKAVRFVLRRSRAAVAFPLLSLGALVMFLRRRLRSHGDVTFDTPVNPPAPVTETPTAMTADSSPSNPETDLPAAPNGSATSEEDKEKAKAAVADTDAPNEGAPGHEPS